MGKVVSVVELREDVPLKSGVADPRRCAGPRLIAAAFAALTAAITVALLTQIYYGDYEVVPHGSVATSEAACSRGGAALLRGGGSAMDAAAAAALCLAAASTARTALDASGSLLYWEYRRSHGLVPTLAEWGAAAGVEGDGWERGWGGGLWPPRLLAALAGLHQRYGRLPWPQLLQPAIAFAESTSEGVSGGLNNSFVEFLRSLQHNSSVELCSAWRCSALLRVSSAEALEAGEWRAFVGGNPIVSGAALRAALQLDGDSGLEVLQSAAASGSWNASGVNSGLAVVDPFGTYVALVTGVGEVEGVEESGSGWGARDRSKGVLDLAPALAVWGGTCGARLVVGAGSSSALAQAVGAMAAGAAPALAVEQPRRPALAGLAPVNLVRQSGDALLSHADSRAGGLASRF